MDRQGVQVCGDLEAQPHGGGDHEAAADGGIITISGCVFIPVWTGFVSAGDGDSGGGAGVEGVHIERALIRTVIITITVIAVTSGVWGIRTAGEAGGGDASQVVAAVRGDGEDLVFTVGRAEEFATQDVYEVGAHGQGGVVQLVGEVVGRPTTPAGLPGGLR